MARLSSYLGRKGPAKSGPIKRLTLLNSGPIKHSRLYYISALRLLLKKSHF